MLTEEGCNARRLRLLTVMEQNQWDLFVSMSRHTAYYLSGVLTGPDAPAAFLLWNDGRGELIEPETYALDQVIDYPEMDLADALRGIPHATSIATERRASSGLLEEVFSASAISDATEAILRLRKRKEPDEIAEISTALDYCAVAYTAARQTIAPGLREVDVYAAMYDAVVKKAGTSMVFNGDFACGDRCIKGGGAPTDRVIKPGDLYILDIFPAPALYFADTCRTFAVGTPSDLQHQAWEIVVQAVELAESMIRPGVAARDVYRAVKEFLDSHELTEKSFGHHVGHGIGHRGHESPRIIPASNDVFEPGDVFTLEPGVYTQALQGGIRLEDNYVVTDSGIRNLFNFPRELL